MAVDEQQAAAIDQREVERRRPALELAAVRHQEAALAGAAFDEHHGDGRARVARAQDAPRLDAGGAQRAAHEAAFGIVPVQREHVGLAAELRGLRERRPDHPAALHQALAITQACLVEAQVIDDVEMVDRR